jgi:uncharacterized protein with HEPN domain
MTPLEDDVHDVIWDVVTADLPQLINKLEQLVRS